MKPRRRLHKRRRTRLWIQKATHKKGALHRMLGVPKRKKIPIAMLRRAAKAPGKLGQRARFALNVRSLRRRKRS